MAEQDNLDYLTVVEDSGLTRAGIFGFQNMEILVAFLGLIGTACILFLLNLPGINKFLVMVVAPRERRKTVCLLFRRRQ